MNGEYQCYFQIFFSFFIQTHNAVI